jgi:hypothetical protein
VLGEEQDRFKNLRRALRKEDQRRFDELFEMARKNIEVSVQASADEPMHCLMLLTLIDILARIEAIEIGKSSNRKEQR